MGRRDAKLRRQTFTGTVVGFDQRERNGRVIRRLLVDEVRDESGDPFGARITIQVGRAIDALDLKRGDKIEFEGVASTLPIYDSTGGRLLRNIPGATGVRIAEGV